MTNVFTKDNLKFVKDIASWIYKNNKTPSSVDLNDLIQWGIEGLIKASKNYKKYTKAHFKSYCFLKIRGKILDETRKEWKRTYPYHYQSKESFTKNKKTAKEIFVVKNDIYDECNGYDEESYNTIEFLETLNSILSPSEVKFIKSIYISGKSQKELGLMLKKHKCNICRQHQRIINKLTPHYS